ncbi:MAG TPA: HAD-IC family P-type ATPase, partial [Burkholderiaceae bacterium]
MNVPGHAADAGLTASEALARLRRDGPNELSRAGRPALLRLSAEVLREPMFLLLFACAALYLLLGDARQAAVLASFVAIVMAVTVAQGWRTERTLAALRDLSSPRALVIRDGSRQSIPGREVVAGDLMLVTEGVRVAADGWVVESTDLMVDESLLTGESMPVAKSVGDPALAGAGDGHASTVFAGTLVVRGRAAVRVSATGMRSAFGRIGRSVQEVESEGTPLQREIARLVRRFALAGGALCIAVAVAFGLLRGDWLVGVLGGLTLAMALLPEEFPMILTVYFALGAWRMAREHVLTRRLSAIETLGAVTALCVDKTGTLTENRMALKRLAAADRELAVDGPLGGLPEEFHELLEFAILAGESEPLEPMELATKSFGDAVLAGSEHLHAEWTATREYALTPVLLAVTRAYRPQPATHAGDPPAYVAAAKGAPEAIIDLCHLGADAAEVILCQVRRFAADGMRVIAVAAARTGLLQLPPQQHDFDFRYLGLIGYANPLRDVVPPAIDECRAAGVRVIMMTGDYPQTATAIARRAGIAAPERVFNGAALRELGDGELAGVV